MDASIWPEFDGTAHQPGECLARGRGGQWLYVTDKKWHRNAKKRKVQMDVIVTASARGVSLER